MEPQIRFCSTADGVRLAYATVGQGPAIIIVPGWISSLQTSVGLPGLDTFREKLARHHTLALYDKHGCGLSERSRTEFSLESEVRQLEAVVEHLKLKHFALWGISHAGPVSAAYAAKHPRRVSHLILYGAYARGEAIGTNQMREGIKSLIRAHWGIGSKTLSDLFLPGADEASIHWFTRLQREATSAEMAAELIDLTFRLNVADLLPKIHIPTLVMHRRGDRAIPFRMGIELAAMIPGARFIPLEGRIHLPYLGDVESIINAMAEFLGDPVDIMPLKSDRKMDVQEPNQEMGDAQAVEAHELIAKLDEAVLSRYRVVGNYTRYGEAVRNSLKDAQAKIGAGCLKPTRKRENHLIWAAPGSGKTYFVQQIAASFPKTIRYQELNLAKCGEQEFRSGLYEIDSKSDPSLCLIDECDAKPQEPWPYEILLPFLDASVDRGAPFVFVLAGSGGANLGEIKRRIASRPKGTDLLSRIPAGNEYEIMPLTIGDRILVVLSQFREVGKEFKREIKSVEKLALYYIALNPRLANARQLREFAARAIERVPPNDDRVKYDHLFSAGDPENKAFWVQAQPVATGLVNSFTMLKD